MSSETEPFLVHATPHVRLYLGNAATVLAALPSHSADCVVTSPPSWRLRDYNPPPATDIVGEQIGQEPTARAYLDRLREVFAELHRVLRPTGTVWLNLGDSYATNSDGYRCSRPGQPGQPRYRPRAAIPDKNLLGMPWQTALALQADGWILRNAVIWHKPNAAPTSTRDRFTTRYETLFLLTRQDRYYFDLDAIRQPYTGGRSLARRAHRGGSRPHGASAPRATWPPVEGKPARDANPGDVWTINAQRGTRGHPPAFPLDLPRRAIAAGCPPGGTVLDPFSGAGTTGLAARQLNRFFLGIDRNPVFQQMAAQALAAPHC